MQFCFRSILQVIHKILAFILPFIYRTFILYIKSKAKQVTRPNRLQGAINFGGIAKKTH